MLSSGPDKLVTALSTPDKWSSQIGVDGGYVLMDPVSYLPLSTNQPPAWVREESVLEGGLEYLKSNAANLHMLVMHTKRAKAEDLGSDPRFEHIVAASDFYGYERGGVTKHDEQRLDRHLDLILEDINDHGARLSAENIVRGAGYLSLSTYDMRSFAAAKLTNTPAFPMDYRADGTEAERALGTAARRLPKEVDLRTSLALLGIQSVREWIAIARLGIELGERFGNLRAAASGLATQNLANFDIKRKLIAHGVDTHRTAIVGTRITPEEFYDARALGSMTATSRVPRAAFPLVEENGRKLKRRIDRGRA